MSRLWLIALMVAIMALFSATDAMAQNSAGWKMQQGGNSFGSSRQRDYRYYGGVSEDSTRSYRSFSYEPMAIRVGDEVTVNGNDVKMMKGPNVVGQVPGGLKFTVTRVVNGWLGAITEVDGKKLNGWIWHNNVTAGNKSATADPQAAGGESQARSYRRFSYEPAEPSGTYRTYERKKEAWRYPKTDPRRYRP
jgi:hypothetical protein